DPSRENDALNAYASVAVAICSSPVHPFHEEPGGKPLVGIVVNPEFPSTLAITAIRPAPVQVIEDGEAFRPGVRLRAAPPATGTSCTSPPVSPASLMTPSISATDFPSGETCGSAICHLGL